MPAMPYPTKVLFQWAENRNGMAAKKPQEPHRPQSSPLTTKLNLIALKPLKKVEDIGTEPSTYAMGFNASRESLPSTK